MEPDEWLVGPEVREAIEYVIADLAASYDDHGVALDRPRDEELERWRRELAETHSYELRLARDRVVAALLGILQQRAGMSPTEVIRLLQERLR